MTARDTETMYREQRDKHKAALEKSAVLISEQKKRIADLEARLAKSVCGTCRGEAEVWKTFRNPGKSGEYVKCQTCDGRGRL